MSLTVSIAQINPIVGSFKQNIQLISNVILQAQKDNSDVILFPELALTGYPPEDLLFRPAFLNKVEDSLHAISQLATDITVIIGAPVVRKKQAL